LDGIRTRWERGGEGKGRVLVLDIRKWRKR
jgi:hypothetical protein